MIRVLFRPSVADDFVALQGSPPIYRSRCTTATVEDRVIGIGGLVYPPDGEIWASVLMADEARQYPAAIHRAGRRAMAEFRRLGVKRVFAEAQPGNPAAERWLLRLGFVAIDVLGRKAFVWRPE